MSSKKERLKNFRLYAVSDLKSVDDTFLETLEELCLGGVDVVQLRAKNLTDRELFRVGCKFREVTQKHEVLFFVNDRVDLALALEADGVHVGQDDLPVSVVRGLAKKCDVELLVGKSTHSVIQAAETLKEDVDYIGVGPVFQTPTKPTYEPVGLDLVRKVSEFATKPFVAIGGINLDNLDQVLDAGATRVAVVRALFDSKEPLNDSRRFNDRLKQSIPS